MSLVRSGRKEVLMSKPKPENRKKTGRREIPEAAKAHQFKPGQSGNPGGRPKKSPITSRLEARAEEPCPPEYIKALKLKPGATWGDAWIEMMNRQALGGEKHGVVQAFREITDRLEGKAIARVEMAGPEGGPIEIEEIRGKLFEKLLR